MLLIQLCEKAESVFSQADKIPLSIWVFHSVCQFGYFTSVQIRVFTPYPDCGPFLYHPSAFKLLLFCSCDEGPQISHGQIVKLGFITSSVIINKVIHYKYLFDYKTLQIEIQVKTKQNLLRFKSRFSPHLRQGSLFWLWKSNFTTTTIVA